MNQTLTRPARVRPAAVRPETASALRDMAFVLTLTRRVREGMSSERTRPASRRG